MKKKYISSQQGFSLLELLIVMITLSIVAGMVMLGTSSSKLYAPDNQALLITDILQEARQKALTQRKTFRVELNDTKKQIRLIDENNTTTTAADDKVVRTSAFNPATTVGTPPANIDPVYSVLPPSGSPIPVIQYTQTNYALSANDSVKTLRFTRTGEVVDGGTDNLGAGANNAGAAIYVYNGSVGSSSSIVRAITLSGITATVQLFKCKTDNKGICISWTK